MLKTFFKVFNSDDHLSREHEIPYVLDCDFHSFVFTCLDLSDEFFWQLAINYAEARKKSLILKEARLSNLWVKYVELLQSLLNNK